MYVDGFVAAVPSDAKEAYLVHARTAAALFREHGATRSVEAWGDDVPPGKVTDFARAVQAREGETVVFAWLEWPNKATRDAGMAAMMQDERMTGMEMPFDGQRMIYGGFAPAMRHGNDAGMGYLDGFLVPVPEGRRDDYVAMAEKASAFFAEHGCAATIETLGDDVPDGKVTDMRRAVQAEAGETVAFSWCAWPSKEARDAGWAAIQADERMKDMPADQPFDGRRMIYGGFSVVLDQ